MVMKFFVYILHLLSVGLHIRDASLLPLSSLILSGKLFTKFACFLFVNFVSL